MTNGKQNNGFNDPAARAINNILFWLGGTLAFVAYFEYAKPILHNVFGWTPF